MRWRRQRSGMKKGDAVINENDFDEDEEPYRTAWIDALCKRERAQQDLDRLRAEVKTMRVVLREARKAEREAWREYRLSEA